MIRRSFPPAMLVLLVSGLVACGGVREALAGEDSTVVSSPKIVASPTVPRRTIVEKQIVEARDRSSLAPDEPYWPFRLAELLVTTDSLAGAETALLASLDRRPFHAPALSLLSKLYFESGRHREAVTMFDSLAARPGGFPDGMPPVLLEGLALHYDALDETDNAAAVLSRIAPRDRERMGASLVYLTLRGQSPDSAAPTASAELKRDGKSAVNQNNYGITRLRAGDPQSAREAFHRAMEIDSDLPGPYYNLAILEKYYEYNDEAASGWFRLYKERSQDDPDGLFDVFANGEPSATVERKD